MAADGIHLQERKGLFPGMRRWSSRTPLCSRGISARRACSSPARQTSPGEPARQDPPLRTGET